MGELKIKYSDKKVTPFGGMKLLKNFMDTYTTPRKSNNFTENLIPKRVKLDDKNRGYKDE